ncbi:MAG: 2Fe-2S iron-sulfur cluster binding domain-containing protein [Treponema sp.]|nr:2Fe-2S iron-sulfur cluster binding domain-containing protein [Treponema sp.]
MNIPILLNGERTMLQASADESLLVALRKNKCLSAKFGCGQGKCGSCTVLLNGKPVASCKIPVAIIMNQEVETLEHFCKSELYQDIYKGFVKAGIKLCGFCNSGKYFATRSILLSNEKPNRQSIKEQIQHLSPCCTDIDSLINGIIYASDNYNRRIGAKDER